MSAGIFASEFRLNSFSPQLVSLFQRMALPYKPPLLPFFILQQDSCEARTFPHFGSQRIQMLLDPFKISLLLDIP